MTGTQSLCSSIWELWKNVASHEYTNHRCTAVIPSYYVWFLWGDEIHLHCPPNSTADIVTGLPLCLQTEILWWILSHSSWSCFPRTEGNSCHGTDIQILCPAELGFREARRWTLWRCFISSFKNRIICLMLLLYILCISTWEDRTVFYCLLIIWFREPHAVRLFVL